MVSGTFQPSPADVDHHSAVDRLLLHLDQEHMLVLKMCVYFIFFLLPVVAFTDTTLRSTITGCLSWNKLSTRSLEASLAQSSLTCLKKLSTCWCIMTGKDTSDICSPRQTHGELTYWWEWTRWRETENKTTKQGETVLRSVHTHGTTGIPRACKWPECFRLSTDSRSLLTTRTTSVARRKLMSSIRYASEKVIYAKPLIMKYKPHSRRSKAS